MDTLEYDDMTRGLQQTRRFKKLILPSVMPDSLAADGFRAPF